MADENGSKERKSRVADAVDAVDAVTEAGATVARWTPQQAMTVMCLVLLAFLCAGFAGQLWIMQEQQKARDRDAREDRQTLIRENNAQVELMRQHCTAELARVVAAEGDKNRVFWREENEKFRREFFAAWKAKGDGP